MKLKLFGLIWDFKVVLAAVYVFAGLLIVGLVFFIPDMGWWNVPYIISSIVYLATAESVSKKYFNEQTNI